MVEKFSKYEKARMIGARALQISMGAPFLVEVNEAKLEEIMYNPIEISKMEFAAGVIPLTVLRRIPEFYEDKSRHPMAGKGEEEGVVVSEDATTEDVAAVDTKETVEEEEEEEAEEFTE